MPLENRTPDVSLNAFKGPNKVELQSEIRLAAQRYGLLAWLDRLYRQCERESSWCATACNLCRGACKVVPASPLAHIVGDAAIAHYHKSCYGPFQLAAATAVELGVARRDWRQNVDGGVRYMGQLLGRYRLDYVRALAAYNWGMGRLARAEGQWGARWADHLPDETRLYIKAIVGGKA